MLLNAYKEELDNFNMKVHLQYFTNKNNIGKSILGHCQLLS